MSERARELNDQIRKLEAQIQDLSDRTAEPDAQPDAPMSAPMPGSAASDSPASPSPPPRRDPVFENVNQQRLQDLTPRPARYNDLGVKKYDLPAAWKRLTHQFRPPGSRNPKLVDLLAAGSIQGMRPLRYEKRIARRRFIAFLILLVLLLWGIAAVLIRN